jgi:hypothetical protein
MSHPSLLGLDQPQQQFVKLIRANAHRHRLHEVFRDFCEMAALAVSNSVDLVQREAREARYLQIVARYAAEEVARFPAMLGCVTESLHFGMKDCLGQLFMSLQLGDHWKGQFFTPYEVARLMARLTGLPSPADLSRRGFVTLSEPACGAGAMLIAAAETMLDAGINYQQHLHVTGVDIDATAVHMAYVQLSLLHVPAIVVHGDALWPGAADPYWVTPAHVLGGWDRKLTKAVAAQGSGDEPLGCAPDMLSAGMPVDELQPAEPPAAVDLATLRAEVVAARVEQLDLF